MNLRYRRSDMIFRSKCQRSRSQGHKVQKHIEGYRVAGVNCTSIDCNRLATHADGSRVSRL